MPDKSDRPAATVVQAVLAFAGPPLLGGAADLIWDAANREWR